MSGNSVTDGKGVLGRIYDRLRKRSQRKLQKADAWWLIYESPHGFLHWSTVDEMIREAPPYVDWWHSNHSSYVEGVRDALNAVQNETSESF